jgi:hypothetical protein
MKKRRVRVSIFSWVSHPHEIKGVNIVMDEDKRSPADFFSLFLEDYECMANETNRYAEQFDEKCRNFQAHFKISFMGEKVLAMGLVVQVDVSEYWTLSEVNATPFFPSMMSRNRHWLLISFFHLADNATLVQKDEEEFDPLFKLGTIFEKETYAFGYSYTPQQHLSLDEGMFPW